MSSNTQSPFPPSVDYHLCKCCNMQCKFCFARFPDVKQSILPRGYLPRDQARALTELLASRSRKITFAGGEPTLCPWLSELIGAAKANAATMLVTNGSLLTPSYLASLAGHLDWIGISIDSIDLTTNRRHGRAVSGRPLSASHYERVARLVLSYGIRLKVNIVVTAINAQEDMSDFVASLDPERVKIFQVLPLRGQNDGKIEPLLVSDEQFHAFGRRYRHLEGRGITLAIEDNAAMTGSYAMVDPAGRFFDNTRGTHTYSRPILEVGIDEAWSDITFDMNTFVKRGGLYEPAGLVSTVDA